VQITEQQILIVVASLAVHYCAIKNNFIVASKLYDVANVSFTVGLGQLEFFSFSKLD